MVDATWFLPFSKAETEEVLDLFLENKLTDPIKLSITEPTEHTTGTP
jgi:hypothetical protein